MKVALIGCGALGAAIARGLLRAKKDQFELRICDRNKGKISALNEQFSQKNIVVTTQAREAVLGADAILIVVKPKDVCHAAAKLRDDLKPDSLVISCAAGIEIQAISEAIGRKIPIARAMPNTAVSISKGTTGVFLGPDCAPARDEVRLHRIFGALGNVRSLNNEDALHVVTALSGSGPAFAILFLESMIEGGVRAGLVRGESDFFSRGALQAAAALIENGILPPSDLRAQITSPAGTTAEGLYMLEKAGFRQAIMDAVEAAFKRSHELTTLNT